MKAFLYAFGDDQNPLPETVRVLDEIVTDFIIETCHQAARSATYSNRQKIKIEDFKFAIRNNPAMLGRVQELLGMDKELKEARKQFDVPEGKAGLEKSKLARDIKDAREGKGRRGKGRAIKDAQIDEEDED